MPGKFSKVVLGNRCPQCLKGKIFRGFYSMNKKCSACGFAFERESGYFLGAMMASYFIAGFSMIPTLVIGLFILRAELAIVLTIGVTQILILHPFLFRYSRLVWIALEHRMTETLDSRH